MINIDIGVAILFNHILLHVNSEYFSMHQL